MSLDNHSGVDANVECVKARREKPSSVASSYTRRREEERVRKAEIKDFVAFRHQTFLFMLSLDTTLRER